MPSRKSIFSVSIAVVVIVAFRLASPQAVSTVPKQRSVSNRVGGLLKVGNLSFKDLNRNGVLDPYEDWRLPVGTRVADLLSRMTLEEKAGLMQITSFNADSLNEYINQRHIRYLILPAITTSVIPMGIVTRTVRALTGDILSQDFVEALRAKGLRETDVFRHVIKNAAPTALAVMGLQLGYMLGGSILIETVFSWPGSGLLLNSAIFQRDLPLLQGTILVLALFFVALNLLVDIAQASIDPRIKRS